MTKIQTLTWALLTAAGGAVGIAIGFALANALK
jgi:zinc transporter ZupT